MSKKILLLAYSIAVTSLLVFSLSMNRPSKENFAYRDDFKIVFDEDVLASLKLDYKGDGPENLYCLIGNISDNIVYITSIESESLVFQGHDILIYKNDPPCQKTGAIGSLHTHPSAYGCRPSSDDYFTFGEMKDPEPVINAVQCSPLGFYIFKMPGKQESFDQRLLRWEIGIN